MCNVIAATCDDIPAILCRLTCTAADNATCVDHIAAEGDTIQVSSVEKADGSCGCPSGYKLDLISNTTHLLCHKRKNCACTNPDGAVHQVISAMLSNDNEIQGQSCYNYQCHINSQVKSLFFHTASFFFLTGSIPLPDGTCGLHHNVNSHTRLWQIDVCFTCFLSCVKVAQV